MNIIGQTQTNAETTETATEAATATATAHITTFGHVAQSSKNVRADIALSAWRRYRLRFALSEPFVWQEVQRRVHERLDVLTVQPRHILDAAPRAGTGALALAARYPKSVVVGHCASRFATLLLKGKYTGYLPQRLWRAWQGKPEARVAWTQVVPGTAYDLIVCNLALTWVRDPVEQLRFWSQQLAPGGVLLFSAFGPDTARSIRQAAQQAGWTTPIAPDFVDMHDYGDMMVQAGLSTPVMDVERLQLTYSSAQRLRQDTYGLMGNLHPQRMAGLAGRGRFKRLEAALDASQPLAIDFELVFGHAFKPLAAPAAKSAAKPALSPISLKDLHVNKSASPPA